MTIPIQLLEWLELEAGTELTLIGQKGKHGKFIAVWRSCDDTTTKTTDTVEEVEAVEATGVTGETETGETKEEESTPNEEIEKLTE